MFSNVCVSLRLQCPSFVGVARADQKVEWCVVVSEPQAPPRAIHFVDSFEVLVEWDLRW